MNNPNQKAIDALRDAANFLEQHHDLPPLLNWSSVRIWFTAKDKDEMANLIRTCGGDWEKNGSEYTFYVTRDINYLVGLGISTSRAMVCTPRKVVKTIPAQEEKVIPAAPERTIEVTEWDCPDSILRPDAPALVAEPDSEREKQEAVLSRSDRFDPV